jgi:hypothetical protein
MSGCNTALVFNPSSLRVNDTLSFTHPFTVVLTSQPASDVQVALSSSNLYKFSTNIITYNTSNWNIPQMIYIATINGDPYVGTRNSMITAEILSPCNKINACIISYPVVYTAYKRLDCAIYSNTKILHVDTTTETFSGTVGVVDIYNSLYFSIQGSFTDCNLQYPCLTAFTVIYGDSKVSVNIKDKSAPWSIDIVTPISDTVKGLSYIWMDNMNPPQLNITLLDSTRFYFVPPSDVTSYTSLDIHFNPFHTSSNIKWSGLCNSIYSLSTIESKIYPPGISDAYIDTRMVNGTSWTTSDMVTCPTGSVSGIYSGAGLGSIASGWQVSPDSKSEGSVIMTIIIVVIVSVLVIAIGITVKLIQLRKNNSSLCPPDNDPLAVLTVPTRDRRRTVKGMKAWWTVPTMRNVYTPSVLPSDSVSNI